MTIRWIHPTDTTNGGTPRYTDFPSAYAAGAAGDSYYFYTVGGVPVTHVARMSDTAGGYTFNIARTSHLVAVDENGVPTRGLVTISGDARAQNHNVVIQQTGAGSSIQGFNVTQARSHGISIYGHNVRVQYNNIYLNTWYTLGVNDASGRDGVFVSFRAGGAIIHGNRFYQNGRIPKDPPWPEDKSHDWNIYLQGVGHQVTCNLFQEVVGGGNLKIDGWSPSENSFYSNIPQAMTDLVANNTFAQRSNGGSNDTGYHIILNTNRGGSNPVDMRPKEGVLLINNVFDRNYGQVENANTPNGELVIMCGHSPFAGVSEWGPYAQVHNNITTTQLYQPDGTVYDPSQRLDETDPAIWSNNLTQQAINLTDLITIPSDVTPLPGSPVLTAGTRTPPNGTPYPLPTTDINGIPFVSAAGAIETAGGGEESGFTNISVST